LYKKVKEWIIAIRLKAIYQNEILAMYCNVYDLGTILWEVLLHKPIFQKRKKNLTIEESAILGMFKNSGLYNPVRNPCRV
jgi:penicillin-binding protein 1A